MRKNLKENLTPKSRSLSREKPPFLYPSFSQKSLKNIKIMPPPIRKSTVAARKKYLGSLHPVLYEYTPAARHISASKEEM